MKPPTTNTAPPPPASENNTVHTPGVQNVTPNQNAPPASQSSLHQPYSQGFSALCSHGNTFCTFEARSRSDQVVAAAPCSCDDPSNCDKASCTVVAEPHLTNKAQDPATNEPTTTTTPQTPQSPPRSPAESFVSADLSDIDLRSPEDDPDYDFIDASEAMHSARNAQPDRADKYPEQAKASKAGSEQAGATEGGSSSKAEAKKERRGWFSLFV
jgi:hypothetical protein